MHYYCKRCGYSTDHLWNLKTHMQKKKICKARYANDSREELLAQLDSEQGKQGFKSLNVSMSDNTDMSTNVKSMGEAKKVIERLSHEIALLKNTNADLTTKLQSTGGVVGNGNTTATSSHNTTATATSSHNTTASHNVTNNNNIYLNNYHHEDTSYITKEELAKLIAPIYEAIPNVIRAIHFHSDHPENHNVRIPGGKEGASECTACGCSCSKYMMVHRLGSWRHEDKRDVLGSLVRKGHTYIDENCSDDVLGQLSTRIRKDFEGLMDEVNSYINKNIEGQGANTQNQPKEKETEKEKEKEEFVAYEDACARMERMILNSKANDAAPTLKR